MIFDGRNLQSHKIKIIDSASNIIEGNEQKQIISSTGNYMTVQFLTDKANNQYGFQVFVDYMPIKPYCSDWLNMAAKLLKSPKFPTINCSWVIIAPFLDSKIIINFEMFEVILCPKYL